MSTGKSGIHPYSQYMCHHVRMADLADIEGVMVEAFDKERNGRWWELVVISQQQ